MRHSFSIAGATVLGLAGLTFAGSAQAVPVASLHQAAPLTIKVGDEGTYIKEEERPNQVTPGSQEGAGEAPKYVTPSGAGEVPSPRRNGRRACATTSAPSQLYRSYED
jgi:hypothetical protein